MTLKFNETKAAEIFESTQDNCPKLLHQPPLSNSAASQRNAISI